MQREFYDNGIIEGNESGFERILSVALMDDVAK